MSNVNEQMLQSGFAAGGVKQDPVSGNEVPVGSLPHEVRDDVDAKLSEGEFVLPADVVRFIGLQKLMQLRDKAKEGLARMAEMGQMGNSDEAKANGENPLGEFDEEDDDGFEAEIDDIMGSGGEVEMAVGGAVPFNEEEENRFYTTSVPPPNVGTRPGVTTPPPPTPPSTTPPATTTPPAPSPTAIPRGGNPAVDYRPVNAQTEELFINNRPTGKYRSPQKAAVSSGGGVGAPPPSPPAGGTGGGAVRDEDGRTPQVGAPTPSVDPGQYAPPGSLFSEGKNIDFGSFNMQDRFNAMDKSQLSMINDTLGLKDQHYDFGNASFTSNFAGKMANFITSNGIKAGINLLGLTGPAAFAAAWGLKKLMKNADVDPAAAVEKFIKDLTGKNAPEVLKNEAGDAAGALPTFIFDSMAGGGNWQWITDPEWEERKKGSIDGLATGGLVNQTDSMLSRDNEINLDAYNFFNQKD